MVVHRISVDKQAIGKVIKDLAPTYDLPSFQRRFVWDDEDIKELMLSIKNNYPIGAIIVWKPNKKFPSVPLVGELSGDIMSKNEKEYVIDGQQRLTSLLFLKHGWKIKRGSFEITSPKPISYNPNTEKIERGRRGIDMALIINAALGDYDSLMKLSDEYHDRTKKLIDEIGRPIIHYELPIYHIDTIIGEGEEDKIYQEMSKVFTRINSAGVKIGKLEMFLSFFAGAVQSEAKKKITDIWKAYEKRYGLELEPILRFIFSNMDLKQHQITKVKSFESALGKIKEKKIDFDELIKKVEGSMQLTFNFLKQELGIVDIGLLPAHNVLIPLFMYFFNNPTLDYTTENSKMIKWFIIASFNGLYSTSPNKKIDTDLDLIRQSEEVFPLNNLLEQMESVIRTNTIDKTEIVQKVWINAYRGTNGKTFRLLLQWVLFKNEADDWTGRKIINDKVAVHHIFPRDFLDSELEDNEEKDKLINALPNLTLVHPDVNSEIGETPPSNYLPQYRSVLEKHFIPNKDSLWEIKNYQAFLEERAKLLYTAIVDALKT